MFSEMFSLSLQLNLHGGVILALSQIVDPGRAPQIMRTGGIFPG